MHYARSTCMQTWGKSMSCDDSEVLLKKSCVCVHCLLLQRHALWLGCTAVAQPVVEQQALDNLLGSGVNQHDAIGYDAT